MPHSKKAKGACEAPAQSASLTDASGTAEPTGLRLARSRSTSIASPVAQSPGRDRSRPLAGMAARAPARLSDPGRRFRRSQCDDATTPAKPPRRGESSGRRPVRQSAAGHPRRRRPASRRPVGTRMARSARARHRAQRRLRLERRHLRQPVDGRQGDHRHELERSSLLRFASGPAVARYGAAAKGEASEGDAVGASRPEAAP